MGYAIWSDGMLGFASRYFMVRPLADPFSCGRRAHKPLNMLNRTDPSRCKLIRDRKSAYPTRMNDATSPQDICERYV
jgi:hypothetical protein